MTMKVGYWGFEIGTTNGWPEFAEIFGLDFSETKDHVFLRYDQKEKRIILNKGKENTNILYAGLELDSIEELEEKVSSLESAGYETTPLTTDECAIRSIESGVYFNDPNNIRFELVLGQKNSVEKLNNTNIEYGFETGENGCLGAGHMALISRNAKKTLAFWQDIMGGRISDRITEKTKKGDLEFTFMRFNERHHSIAWCHIPFDVPNNFHHIEIQAKRIIDVGRANKRAIEKGVPVIVSLGQHPNDSGISFYSITPGKFVLELGSNCITIPENEDWEIKHYDHITAWGHIDTSGLTD